MATDTRYFTHDQNARHDPKIKALIKKYGIAGYGRYWIIIETMRENAGYKINQKKYVLEAFAEQMQCTASEVKAFLKDCVEEFELFTQQDDFIYSESLLERMSKLDNLRVSRQRGAYAMHEKYHHNITSEPGDND